VDFRLALFRVSILTRGRKKLELDLILETKDEKRKLIFNYERMVNAGYVGKNQKEVRRHIQELAEKGIPGPKSTPVLFPVVCRTLVTDSAIEVYSKKTSGEASENEVYVGLGSDHTDRHLEEIDIPRSKQICPNLMSRKVWLLEEVEDHWDDLLMKATVVKDGQEILYQQGFLGLLLNPTELMAFVRSKFHGSLENLIIFSGTIGMLTGEFVFAEKFSAQMIDEKLKRRIEIGYDVRPLDYLELD
jgi:hypothetical protein